MQRRKRERGEQSALGPEREEELKQKDESRKKEWNERERKEEGRIVCFASEY